MKSNLLVTSLILSLYLLVGCSEDSKVVQKIIPYSFSNDRESTIFSVSSNDTKIPVTVVPNVDPGQAEHIVEQYKKLPEYCWIESKYATAHYIHFAADSVSEIDLTIPESIEKFTIYPKRANVKTKLEDNTLHLSINRNISKYYLLSINELPMFVILTESMGDNSPDAKSGDVISLKSFMDTEEPLSDYSGVFDKALAAVNGTGKTLFVPAGEYLTDAIVINGYSDFNIYLESGSLIKTKISPPGENIMNAGILIKNSKNIRIYGNGCLDHQAYENFHDGINDYHHGFPGYDFYFKFEDIPKNSIYLQSPLLLMYSQNITVEGLLIRNGRNYNVNSRHCDNITIRNVKVITPAGSVPENTDGINIGSYRNFHIENSFVYCNDDCFSMGHTLMPYDNRSEQNLVIKNFMGWNPRANAIRLGWAKKSHNGDMLFQNCDFAGMDDCAMQLHKHTSTGEEPADSLCYGTVRFENCTFDDVEKHTMPLLEVQNICMESFEFVNVTFDVKPKIKARVYGDEEKKIGTLLIDNMTIGGKKVTKENFYFETKNIRKIIIR